MKLGVTTQWFEVIYLLKFYRFIFASNLSLLLQYNGTLVCSKIANITSVSSGSTYSKRYKMKSHDMVYRRGYICNPFLEILYLIFWY